MGKSISHIAVICWFAVLFYLPRLFVYHAMSEDQVSKDRFIIMERKLLRGIGNPSMIATLLLGIWLVSYQWEYYQSSTWFGSKYLALSLSWHITLSAFIYGNSFAIVRIHAAIYSTAGLMNFPCYCSSPLFA